MSGEWFYREGSRELGPVAVGQLRLLLLENRLTAETLVSTGVGSRWRRAIDVPELADAARSSFRSFATAHWRATRGHWAIPLMLALLAVPVLSLLKPVVGWWVLLAGVLVLAGLTIAFQLLYRVQRRLAYAVDCGQVRPEARSLSARLCFAGYLLLLPWAAVVGAEYFTGDNGLLAGAVPELQPLQDKASDKLVASKDFLFGKAVNTGEATSEPVDSTKGRHYAVIIGINNYSDPFIDKLKCSVADAKLIARQLVESCGYDENDVLLLTDDSDKDQLRPRRSCMKQVAEWLKNPTSRNDTMLVFFSGHGFIDKQGQSYLAPQDCEKANPVATCWRTSELRTMLERCKAAQKLLVLDCCFAAGKAGTASSASSEDLGIAFKNARGLITLASCSKDEVSFEWEEKKHGLFTYFLAEGLRGEADKPPYGNGDGIVDSDELYYYTLGKVKTVGLKELNRVQTPVHIIDAVGKFPLARVPSARVASASAEPPPVVVSRDTPVTVRSTPPPQTVRDTPPPPPPQTVRSTPPPTTVRPPPPPPVASGDGFKNDVGMELKKIAAGTFPMGSPSTEAERNNDEKLHTVTITRAFFMGIAEVTQDEYVRVTKKPNPSYFKASEQDMSRYPVEQVSHAEAEEFCRLLTQLDKKKPAGWEYRLPTEAEWEYACRGNTTTPYIFGETLTARQANFSAFPFGGATPGLEMIGTRTLPVRTHDKNAFGLHDMHGNVAEWCADFFNKSYYDNSPSEDPTGPENGKSYVVRGGSWSDGAARCRSASRAGFALEDRRSNVGFRVVCAPAR
jgi:formylglycine-generating enzyme required for sulfatase activity